jgi:coenzyme F420-reducing hydrogenase beta subunit
MPAGAMSKFVEYFIGPYKKVCLTWAIDNKLRYNSASGGVATVLLKYLLEKNYVDAVIVPSPRFKRCLTYGVWTVVREPSALDTYSGSLYAPVYGLSKILNYSLTKFKRIAITAVPCYARAIRRVLESRGRSGDVFIVGLYCYNAPITLATRYALKYFNINVEDVERVRYRGCGWPGYTIIETRRGTIRVPYSVFFGSGFGQYFYSVGCYLCADQTNTSADLSLADPWTLPHEPIKRLGGATLVVVRSERGLDVFRGAVEAGYLFAIEVDPVYAIQDTTLLKLSRKTLKKGINTTGKYLLPPDFTTITYELTYLVGHFLASRERLWPLLRVYHKTLRPLALKTASVLDYRLHTTWSKINALIKTMQRTRLPSEFLSLAKRTDYQP